MSDSPQATVNPHRIQPKPALYLCVMVSLLQPFQSGWSTSQLNLDQFNDTSACNSRPVAVNSCLMFPGHSKLQWTFAVNAWIFGAMIGSLFCGRFSDKWGRKKLLFVNCSFIIVGAVVQMSVSNIWLFSVGRFIAGIASGVATGTIGAYVSELSPPHLRNILGLGLQISVTFGIMMPAVAFFFANTSSGWRFLAGFPIVLGVLFLLLAPYFCEESPVWLMMENRQEEAERVITRCYGTENVNAVLEWLATPKEEEEGLISEKQVKDSMFDPIYRRQLAGAVLLSCSQQLSGINAVFYYSSSIFADAGISDPRVGTLIIDFINIWPAFFTGVLAIRFGNRNMILWGLAGMLVMALGMTLAFLVDVPALSVLFTALYVITFGVTLGPLVWVMTADIFPDSIRASASSLCIGINWFCNLVVGVSYPYLAEALKDFSYLPFVALLALFYCMAYRLIPETSATASSPEVSTISAADAVQPNAVNQRFLRSDYDSEERTVLLPNFAKLDDVVVAKMAGNLFNTEKLKSALGKTTEASNARKALFNEVNAANPAVRKAFLAKLTKSDYNWLLPYWFGFKLKNPLKFDAAEIAAARRAGNAVN